MFNQNKQNLESNEDARCLAAINTFIANSRQQLNVLSSLSLETKKKITLNIVDIAIVSTNIIQKRELQIFSAHLEIENCKSQIATLTKEFNALQTSQTKIIQRIREKHKLHKEISLLQEKIASLQSELSSYRSEINIYQTALNICSEFSRRLKFFLEYEENFSS